MQFIRVIFALPTDSKCWPFLRSRTPMRMFDQDRISIHPSLSGLILPLYRRKNSAPEGTNGSWWVAIILSIELEMFLWHWVLCLLIKHLTCSLMKKCEGFWKNVVGVLELGRKQLGIIIWKTAGFRLGSITREVPSDGSSLRKSVHVHVYPRVHCSTIYSIQNMEAT